MPLKRIAKIGRVYPRRVQRNQRTLLNFAGDNANIEFNTIEELRAYLGVDTREEALEIPLET